MSREQAEAQIKAAAWAAAAALGVHEATKLLQQVAREIEGSLWQGPGNR